MNFLVVDDNRLLNRFLVTYLRSKGHSCSSLTDGSKVESWLNLNACDAVILDIGMPKIDGLTLISVIRGHHAELPIIIFTGLGYDEVCRRQWLRQQGPWTERDLLGRHACAEHAGHSACRKSELGSPRETLIN